MFAAHQTVMLSESGAQEMAGLWLGLRDKGQAHIPVSTFPLGQAPTVDGGLSR